MAMATQAELRERLADIDNTLSTGVSSQTTDGVQTVINHDTLRRERAAILVALGLKRRKSRVFNLNMGGR